MKKLKYTKKIKLSKNIKPSKLSLTNLTMTYKEKGIKGFFKKKTRKFNLPKGSIAMEIFYRPYNNTIYIKYIKK